MTAAAIQRADGLISPDPAGHLSIFWPSRILLAEKTLSINILRVR
jgi:hypothetical protein